MANRIMTCEICKKNKITENLEKFRISEKFYLVCKECKVDLNWTRACLVISVNALLEKFREKFVRLSSFVVKPIE